MSPAVPPRRCRDFRSDDRRPATRLVAEALLSMD